MPILSHFDHMSPPLGRDGTAYRYFETLRDMAVASGRFVFWSEMQGGFWALIGFEEIVEIARNTVRDRKFRD